MQLIFLVIKIYNYIFRFYKVFLKKKVRYAYSMNFKGYDSILKTFKNTFFLHDENKNDEFFFFSNLYYLRTNHAFDGLTLNFFNFKKSNLKKKIIKDNILDNKFFLFYSVRYTNSVYLTKFQSNFYEEKDKTFTKIYIDSDIYPKEKYHLTYHAKGFDYTSFDRFFIKDVVHTDEQKEEAKAKAKSRGAMYFDKPDAPKDIDEDNRNSEEYINETINEDHRKGNIRMYWEAVAFDVK